jgi:hypothetical protein
MPAPVALLALASRLGIRGAKKIIERHGIPRLKTMIKFESKSKRAITRGSKDGTNNTPKGYKDMDKRLDKYSADLRATRGSKNRKVKTRVVEKDAEGFW